MGGGVLTNHADAANIFSDSDNASKLTPSVVIICIVAASAGLIFGYDVGVSGGVTTMAPFLEKFFPFVLQRMADAKQSQYCLFDSQTLTAFTSSFYIAGLVSSLIAGAVNTTTGRRGSLIIGGVVFMLGTALNAFAFNLWMLIAGRLLLGFGVGFTNQAAPVYLSEMAPPKWRGTLSTGFQLFLTLGVILACIINFAVAKHGGDYGWRIALGGGGVLALIMTIGALLIPDTPSSLIQRGKVDAARRSLLTVRGRGTDSEAEPHLVLAIAIPSFQQLTGISVIAFYGPVLFRSIGFGSDGALIGAIILGAVNIISTLVSTYAVDRLGRRILFLQAGIQIFICQIALAILLFTEIGTEGTRPFSKNGAVVVLVLTCSITAAFAWSWGPLTWLIPSEILPMEVRPAGQGICIAFNFVVTFILSQSFLAVLCHLKFGVFLFYAAWVTIMTIFVALLVPETKGIPLPSMDHLWQKHWLWRRYVQGTAFDR
ncbi:Sugar/inositol transporter [Corchorus olitorius]|uniref:Sugar/inositol transporter n=1 Tax=Corchorus olitorius TaxID=93759 RepID=A0A1R3I5P9_9ROSI|nr:Sugar/inositol transporter [Corchorus olitorius]